MPYLPANYTANLFRDFPWGQDYPPQAMVMGVDNTGGMVTIPPRSRFLPWNEASHTYL